MGPKTRMATMRAEHELAGDGDRQPDGLGKPARGGNQRLCDGEQDRGRAIDAAQHRDAATVREEAADHASSSRSSSAVRVASSWPGWSHARRARSTA